LTRKADFPGGVRYFGCGFSIGDKGYVTCGFTGIKSTKDLWEYDASSDTWTRKSDLPALERHHAVAFTIGHKAYLGTGWCDTTGMQALKDFWQWDQKADAWTRIADFGGGRRQGGVAFAIGTKGYVGTGESYFNPYGGSTLEQDFWEWDEPTNTWTRKADYGGGKIYHGLAFTIGSSGFVGFGINDKNGLSDQFWEWNSQTEQWIQRSAIPQCERFCGSTFSMGNYGYILLGTDSVGKKDLWQMNNNTTSTQTNEIADIHVWPNPANHNIQVAGLQTGDKVEIINQSGNIVKEIGASSESESVQLFPSGNYFLKVVKANSVHVQKILVLDD
jgi:N-acetylneuraminic acid mutarotase